MTNKLYNALYVLILLIITVISLYLINLIKIFNICCTLIEIISPVFFGYILVWLLNPIYKKLNKSICNKLSISIIFIVLILSSILFIVILLPILIKECTNLYQIIMDFLPKIQSHPFASSLFSALRVTTSHIIKYCTDIVTLIISFIFAHVFAFYILFNYSSVNKFIRDLLLTKYKLQILKFTKSVSSNMYCFIKGTLIDTLILFIASSILFAIFHLKYSILLALFCSITNIIPFIGPYIGCIPAVLVGLSSNVKLGIIKLIIIWICQTIESNIVNPLIMSKCIKISPVLILLAVTVMGKFFGILGMLFAAPVLIIVKILYHLLKK